MTIRKHFTKKSKRQSGRGVDWGGGGAGLMVQNYESRKYLAIKYYYNK
jgi:hypothetical protein